ncbi:putative aliphatic sulfonates-binding protein [compost metagenome]
MRRRSFLRAVGALTASAGAGNWLAGCGPSGPEAGGLAEAAGPLAEDEYPKLIRMAPHGTWGTLVATGVMGIMQTHGYLEDEFKGDGVRIQWSITDGSGPGVNEAIANGLLDFSSYGGLPNIIGRSRGLRTRILASPGYQYSYVAVRSGFAGDSPKDLRGATIGVAFGTYLHLSTAMLLKEHDIGLDEVRLVNLATSDAAAALAAGRVDACMGGVALFPLEDQGLARIIYMSEGRHTQTSGFGGFIGVEDFTRRYPLATRKVVKAYLRATHWVSLPENREAFFRFSAQHSTVPLEYLRRDFEGQDLSARFNVLLDDYYVERFRQAIDFSLAHGITRSPIDLDAWLDRRTIQDALAELGLSDFWTAWDSQGLALGRGGRSHAPA